MSYDEIVVLNENQAKELMNMPDVIEALEEEGIRDQVNIAIGGAPVSQDYADEIGADGYAADAAAAVDLVKDMTNTN